MIVHNPGAPSPFLLLGDHAGRAIPRELGDLGLAPIDLERHIAWDIGVDGLGRAMAQLLDATFIAQTVSRLVIDCNRDPARSDAFCEVSDGTPVPGNLGLSPEARAGRIETIFRPYHAAITAELDRRQALSARTIVVALHSFTPILQGAARPWEFGVLHMGDSRFSTTFLKRLRTALGSSKVGDNEPYAMDGTDYTVPHHAIRRGLDYLEIEVRQDLLQDEDSQAAIAVRLAAALNDCLGEV
jgi:predicted N-formylglutamate amidohydrolase